MSDPHDWNTWENYLMIHEKRMQLHPFVLEEVHLRTYTDGSGRAVRVSTTQAYDQVAQILHWTTYRRWREGDQEQTRITRIAARYIFPQELAALLHYNGFTILRQYGDWNLEPLTAASPSIIVACTAFSSSGPGAR